jgi:hypothetical protein
LSLGTPRSPGVFAGGHSPTPTTQKTLSQNVAFGGPVADFTDTDGNTSTAQYTATIS